MNIKLPVFTDMHKPHNEHYKTKPQTDILFVKIIVRFMYKTYNKLKS